MSENAASDLPLITHTSDTSDTLAFLENIMPTIKFAPGVLEAMLESVGGDEAELHTLLADIERQLKTGELMKNSVEVDMDELMESDPDLHAHLLDQLDQANNTMYH